MTRKPHVWLLFSLICWLLHSQVANGQLIADLDLPTITEGEDGLFTYEYTVSNSFLSGASVNLFLLSVVKGTDVVIEDGLTWPEGWFGDYDPLLPSGSVASDQQIVFLTGDGFDCGVEANAVNIGESADFVVKSRYGPGEGSFLIANWDSNCDFVAFEDGNVQVPLIPPETSGPSCDFDGDGDCDLVDIDALSVTIAGGTNPADFDLTGDTLVNLDDLSAFLEDENVNKLNGDADFDGSVAFPDFLVLANNFGNEGVWSQGNFVPDTNEVGFSDFLAFANNFGESAGGLATSVPEPANLSLAGLALFCLSIILRRRQARA